MAQLREEGALSEERANYFRAVLANVLSVEVLHEFLDTAVPKEKDWHNNQYWMSEVPKEKLKGSQRFQQDAIKKEPPQKWDMARLAFAILNNPSLVEGKQEFKDAVEKMRDSRNVLSHILHATYEKKEYDKLFIDLEDSYKSLLGEPEARRVKKLRKIKEKRIYDKWTEKKWIDVLEKRDEAVCNAEGREEVIMKIHTELEENIKKRVKQNEDDIVEINKRQDRLESRVDEISRTTTVHKGSDGAGVQADGPDTVPQERVFKEKDLHDILTLTKNAAHKWTFIGLALGFEKGNLDLIEQNLMIFMRGPRALYTEMLSGWLKWAPPKHPLPTSTALAAALRSDTVEEDLLASVIEKKFGGGPEE